MSSGTLRMSQSLKSSILIRFILFNEFSNARVMIHVAPKAQGIKRLDLLFVFVLMIVYNKHESRRSTNILVLSKDIGQDTKYVRFLEASTSEFINVGSAYPHTFISLEPSGSEQAKAPSGFCAVCSTCIEILHLDLRKSSSKALWT
ncbi:unnamed protein product [Arabis nemorensis]|uniref:Uncharacterized protein n=1 Tax=Arabis nemorensis TaxID=586526 RepID=A0A565CBP7_9BRAS|nr:unnamed protein product [Arabis nemorensis]